MESKFDLVLFDFDNTLFDYEKTEIRALCETFSLHGLPYKERYYDTFKQINRELWKTYTKKDIKNIKFMKKQRFKQLLEQIKISCSAEALSDTYTKLSQKGDIIEGVEETINKLYENIQLIIISNGPITPRSEKLENSPIAGKLLFFSSETFDGKFEKPDPKFFQEIISKFDVPNERILMVGDKLESDILGANRTGIKSVWFNYKEQEENYPEAIPDFIINKFSDLIRIIYGG